MRQLLLIGCLWLALTQSTWALAPETQMLQQEHRHQTLIEGFYTAFAQGDGAAMAAAYHPEARFFDPVFGELEGREIGAMWQMLLALSQGQLKIQHDPVIAQAQQVRTRWLADYHFSLTGLPVHNIIEAQFVLRDGLIYRHHDQFDLARWTGMALGAPGALFGNQPWIHALLRERARAQLQEWMRTHP